VRRLLNAPPRRFSQKHWEQIDQLAAAPGRIPPQTLPLGLIAKGGKSSISFSFEKPKTPVAVDIPLTLNGVTQTPIGNFEAYTLDAAKLPLEIKANEAYFDLSQMNGALTIRNLVPGLRIYLPQLGHKRISKLLSEAAIPRHLRFSYPILWLNETVLWVPGIRRSSHALVSSESRAILGIKYHEQGSN
jgi:tRNA(Ile)-lysidine synthase